MGGKGKGLSAESFPGNSTRGQVSEAYKQHNQAEIKVKGSMKLNTTLIEIMMKQGTLEKK